jgi:drug/metabolite transporter (DMT)-like permease
MVQPAIDRRKAILFLVIAAVLWSTSGILVKVLPWSPMGVLAGRSIFSSLVFLFFLRRFPFRPTRWQLFAAGSYILTQFFYISSIRLTTAANAIFLQYTAPIYIIFLAYWLLREKPSRADWVSMAVIFAGFGLFFGDKLSLDGFYGNLMAVLSGISLAMMTVAMRAQKDGSPAESFCWQMWLRRLWAFISSGRNPGHWSTGPGLPIWEFFRLVCLSCFMRLRLK